MARNDFPFRWSHVLFGSCLIVALSACDSSGSSKSGMSSPPPVISPVRPNQERLPLLVEAEGGGSGVLVSRGHNMAIVADTSMTYVTTSVTSTTAPTNKDRVVTLDVHFPQAGIYDVYIRLRVGAGGGNDDSLYLPSALGSQFSWMLVEGVPGFAVPGEEGHIDSAWVDAGGSTATQVWRWHKVPNIQYEVPIGQEVQSFSYAGREEGLWIDKFAFARPNMRFTAAQLDNEEEGTRVDVQSEPESYTPPASHQPLAANSDKFLGGVCCGTQAMNFASYFNQVVAENAGKWGSVEAVRDEYNWAELDRVRNVAITNNIPFRFHVLLWGNQQPSWIENLPAAEQREEIEEWMRAVSERYGDEIDLLEVVNEFHNDPPDGATNGNYMKALGGRGDTGYDWILEAFRLARDIFPSHVKLMINEYNVLSNWNGSADATVTVANLLKAEGLIDAIGFQAHAFSTTVTVSEMTNNLNKLHALGLPLYATEMDIDGPEVPQLVNYQRVFKTIWEHPGVKGVTLWGYRPGMWRDAEGATLVHENGAEKLAMRWLRGYVGDVQPRVLGSSSVTINSSAAVGSQVTAFNVQDPDGEAYLGGTEIEWALMVGNEARLFHLHPDTGVLTVAAPLVKGTYNLRLHVSVGGTSGGVLSDLFNVRVVVN